ncbi:paired amphipathic helix protein Sin3-like 5 isoform X2 [Magnolia sinica]|uniref:paired amphipathic helix protein Sin3-like 5 isoform X2 n=1 Tax=Magnolia sinica TaxID=86752 RepID=UPI0026597BBF|nr:paired amphipathic helix protein Sin3-like 5 isoform X2 [Magnolia sinica]
MLSTSSGNVMLGQPPCSQKLTIKDSLAYLKTVKQIFQDRREKYAELLEITKDFYAERINITSYIWRVKELSEGHPELFLGFIKFWPEEYKITFNEEPPEDKIAINFVDKIKVALLFREHHDLLEEFTHFLPDATGMAPLPHALPARNSSGNFLRSADERSLLMPMVPQVHGEKNERSVIRHTGCDLSIAHPESDDKRTTKVDKKRRKRKRNDKDLEHDSNTESDNGQRLSHKQKYAQTQGGHAFDHDAELLHQVGEGAKNFVVHPILEFPSKEGHLAGQMKSDERDKEKEHERVDREKDRGHEREREKNQDCFDKNGPKDVARPKVPVLLNKEKHVTAPISGLDLLKNCRMPPASQQTEQEASVLKREKEGERFNNNGANDIALPNVPVLLNEDRCMAKPISEPNLSNCQSCTPSYRYHPEKYQMSRASERTELDASILNDDWVSVGSYPSESNYKNQYEESQFKCEDVRFKFDMLLESANLAVRCVEQLLEKINDSTIKPGSQIHIKDHFTGLSLSCIVKLYDDSGLDMLNLLRNNASAALPVILARLKQKREEWLKCRSDFSKAWAEVYAKSHPNRSTV